MTEANGRIGPASAGVLVLAVGLAGCGGRHSAGKAVRREVQRQVRKQAQNLKDERSTLTVEASHNKFRADDAKGLRILEAKVGRMTGRVKGGGGIAGPALFQDTDARMFQKGKLQLSLKTPEATWDGKQFVTNKTAHGATPDGRTVIDAQTAVWTHENGQLDLGQATLQNVKDGKTDFTVQGPKAVVLDRVVTLPAGGAARNPDGQQMKADHIRWWLDTNKLEAKGHVRLWEKGSEITGRRLVANTKLKKGRMSGGARVHFTRLPTANKPRQQAANPRD